MIIRKYKFLVLVFIFLFSNVFSFQRGPVVYDDLIIEKGVKYEQRKYGELKFYTIKVYFKKPTFVDSADINEVIGENSTKWRGPYSDWGEKSKEIFEFKYTLYEEDELYTMNNIFFYIIETDREVYFGKYKYVDKTDPKSTKKMRLDDPNVILVPIPKKRSIMHSLVKEINDLIE